MFILILPFSRSLEATAAAIAFLDSWIAKTTLWAMAAVLKIPILTLF